jgi:hypothetical protein
VQQEERSHRALPIVNYTTLNTIEIIVNRLEGSKSREPGRDESSWLLRNSDSKMYRIFVDHDRRNDYFTTLGNGGYNWNGYLDSCNCWNGYIPLEHLPRTLVLIVANTITVTFSLKSIFATIGTVIYLSETI